MNYIREINAFMDWLEVNPLDATTQTLWFHLMAIANKCGWPEWFTVANLTLMAKVGISENTLAKHRNILVQKGRIEYKNQGKKAGRYRIIPFASKIEVKSNITSNFEVNHEANLEVNHEVIREVKREALNKLNETKRNSINDDDNSRPGFVTVYEQEFGRLITPGVFHKLNEFYQDGMSDEVIAEAIRRAAENGAYNVKYISTILDTWQKQNVINMAGVKRADAEYERRKARKHSERKPQVADDEIARKEEKYRDVYQ